MEKKIMTGANGLGDAVIISGAVVYLSKIYGGLRYACSPHYKRDVESFFVNYPEIEVVELSDELYAQVAIQNKENYYWLNYGWRREPIGLVQTFYKDLDVPYIERWDSCPIREAAKHVKQLEVPGWKYAFVHDHPSRGFSITRFSSPLLTIQPDLYRTNSILSYVDLIENAEEVHCIDSAFLHLVESVEPKGRLFWHHYARPSSKAPEMVNIALKLNWTVLK